MNFEKAIHICYQFCLFRTAKPCSGKSLNSVLFDAWVACEGEWKKSSFLQKIQDRHSSKKRGTRKWLTAQEMDLHFGSEAGLQIRERKLLDPELKEKEVRAHPELPTSKD